MRSLTEIIAGACCLGIIAFVGKGMFDKVQGKDQLSASFAMAGVTDPVKKALIEKVIKTKNGDCAVLNDDLVSSCEHVKQNAAKLGYTF